MLVSLTPVYTLYANFKILGKETGMRLGALLVFGTDKTRVLFKAWILSGQGPDIDLMDLGHLLTINNRVCFHLAVIVEMILHTLKLHKG